MVRKHAHCGRPSHRPARQFNSSRYPRIRYRRNPTRITLAVFLLACIGKLIGPASRKSTAMTSTLSRELTAIGTANVATALTNGSPVAADVRTAVNLLAANCPVGRDVGVIALTLPVLCKILLQSAGAGSRRDRADGASHLVRIVTQAGCARRPAPNSSYRLACVFRRAAFRIARWPALGRGRFVGSCSSRRGRPECGSSDASRSPAVEFVNRADIAGQGPVG